MKLRGSKTPCAESVSDLQAAYDVSVRKEIGDKKNRMKCTEDGCDGHYVINDHIWRYVELGGRRVRLLLLQVKCSKCGKTHVIQVSFVVPYQQMSLPDQLSILTVYEEETGPDGRLTEEGREKLRSLPCVKAVDEKRLKRIRANFRRVWAQIAAELGMKVSDQWQELSLACFDNFGRQMLQMREWLCRKTGRRFENHLVFHTGPA